MSHYDIDDITKNDKLKIAKEQYKLPDKAEPFLGKIIVEIVTEDIEDYLKEIHGIGKSSLIVLPDTVKIGRMPLQKGKIVKKAQDAFGEAFRQRYGNDFKEPKDGDVVWWIPNQSYKIDIYDKFHAITDQDIVLVEYNESK